MDKVKQEDLFSKPMLAGDFYCFKWEANNDHEAFFVEESISRTREGAWDYILKGWPVKSHPRGRKGVKQKIFTQGGHVVPVRVTEFLESKQKPGGSYDQEHEFEEPAVAKHHPVRHKSA